MRSVVWTSQGKAARLARAAARQPGRAGRDDERQRQGDRDAEAEAAELAD